MLHKINFGNIHLVLSVISQVPVSHTPHSELFWAWQLRTRKEEGSSEQAWRNALSSAPGCLILALSGPCCVSFDASLSLWQTFKISSPSRRASRCSSCQSDTLQEIPGAARIYLIWLEERRPKCYQKATCRSEEVRREAFLKGTISQKYC